MITKFILWCKWIVNILIWCRLYFFFYLCFTFIWIYLPHHGFFCTSALLSTIPV